MPPLNGFTLIELLVVVSILAILIAVLLAGLARAKAYSRLVVCRTHINSVLKAHAMYGSASSDQKPALFTQSGLVGFVSPNIRVIQQFGAPAVLVGQGLLIGQKLIDREALLCPSAEMMVDNNMDSQNWNSDSRVAGSSFWYFWLMPADPSNPTAQPQLSYDLTKGMTYQESIQRHLSALTSDVNLEGANPMQGAPAGNSWPSHPEFQLTNIGFINGSVRGFPNPQACLHTPGLTSQQLQLWQDASDCADR